MNDNLIKEIIKDAAYNKCNIGHENYIYHILEEAFKAGAQYATFNGMPGYPDFPDFEQWIRIKAYEE